MSFLLDSKIVRFLVRFNGRFLGRLSMEMDAHLCRAAKQWTAVDICHICGGFLVSFEHLSFLEKFPIMILAFLGRVHKLPFPHSSASRPNHVTETLPIR